MISIMLSGKSLLKGYTEMYIWYSGRYTMEKGLQVMINGQKNIPITKKKILST